MVVVAPRLICNTQLSRANACVSMFGEVRLVFEVLPQMFTQML